MSLARILFYTYLNKIKKYSFITRRCYSQHAINLSDTAVHRYLRHLMLEHENLLRSHRTPEEVQRLRYIQPIVNVLEQRIALYDSIESLKELNKKDNEDIEVKKMIKEEAQIYLSQLNLIDNELQSILLEPHFSEGGVLLEVAAGAGGQEAMLFARELCDLYVSYAKYKDWEVNITSYDQSSIGGVRKACLIIEGIGVPELMKLEAGVHRVQRIPVTEKSGRMHTSTASVAVLPKPTDIKVDLSDSDITIQTMRASGAGGQHVNTTDSAVRIIHNPTGVTVECQEQRTQIKNKEIALNKLRAILLEKEIKQQYAEIDTERKNQIGNSDRNEKIRTYNYQQGRVTDHRDGGLTINNLNAYMEGREQVEKLQLNLLRHQKYKMLMDDINNFIEKYNIKHETPICS